MDRFIEIILNYMVCVCIGLKSNMDRFIELATAGAGGSPPAFKIQYG